MALGVRGFNPIWVLFNLQGKLFDDTYYLFVLENTIPYMPATVYHDIDLNTPWTNPIRFLANGTLPVDIYFEEDTYYRLEFRQGPTQADPLIYEVNNYLPGDVNSTDNNAPTTGNQITNPQFSLISFGDPLELTAVTNPDTIEVGPGWFLDLTGTGNLTLSREALTSTPSTPSNAPYALRLQLSGWDAGGVVLRQRFQQNGVLWASKSVSNAVTARVQGSNQTITATLVDSNGTTLATVLNNETVTSTFTEFTGVGSLGISTNPDVPPVAYIDYKLFLPTDVDIYITSLQLIVQNLADISEPAFEQDSIERQVDHTFHVYRQSLLEQPKESLLTGWDFGLNPWQFTTTASTTLAAQCAYTADQTIIYQQAGGSEVATARGTAAENYAFEVKAIGNNSRFAVIQYIDPSTVRDVWGYVLSSLVRAYISSPTHDSAVRFKMRLIWRDDLPPTIGATQPIFTWTGIGDPVFTGAGWTAVTPTNDPVYTFGERGESFAFEGMELPESSSDNMTLGIVLYTIDPIIETATADRILFERISLCRNDFAIDGQILTFDETLRRCQFYFESSKNLGVLLTTSGAAGGLIESCNSFQNGGDIDVFPRSFELRYNTVKRNSPTVSIYALNGTVGQCTVFIRDNGAQIATTAQSFTASGWSGQNGGNKGQQYLAVALTASPFFSFTATLTNSTDAYISFHYGADSRLGI